ncbi:hypothetical protein LDENG_00033260 [Lucifuga dentata]|nr:hypothetical protein LDENG_00033260 [Lucifuga dentata]
MKMILILAILITKRGVESADWSVTFENPNPCALKGSSVEFRCSYDYPVGETVKSTAWFKGEIQHGIWQRTLLSTLSSYEGRVEYLGDQQHNCSLAIYGLQDNDNGYYYFRFDTQTYGRHSKRSVYLSVSELKARVHPDSVKAGESVTLTCGTSCQLNGMVWFKDGQPAAKAEFQARIEDAGKYSCAVEGQELMRSDPVALDVQYPPVNVSVEVSRVGRLSESSSVNLTCSSAANPAANSYTWYWRSAAPSSRSLQPVGSGSYTWYWRSAAPSSRSLQPVGSGSVLSLSSVEASHSGLYLCQASNPLGENNSTELLLELEVKLWEADRLMLCIGIGAKVIVVLVLSLVLVWFWKRRCTPDAEKEECSHDYENIRIKN